MGTDGSHLLEILDKRSEILQYLVESPAQKPEIVNDLDVSRSTVDRAISELIETDCIIEDGSTYVATITGRLVRKEHQEYKTTIQAIEQSGRLINYFPEAAPIDPVLLEDATITFAESHAPDQALLPSRNLVAEANCIMGLAPVVRLSYLSTISTQLDREDFEAEIVAEANVISALSSFSNEDVDKLLLDDSAIIYKSEKELPYALWIMESDSTDYAGITVYDDGGIAGTIINDSQEGVQWARDVYQEYRSDAATISKGVAE